METKTIKESQYFYYGQDITRMQIWELIDALADLLKQKEISLSQERYSHQNTLKGVSRLCHLPLGLLAFPNKKYLSIGGKMRAKVISTVFIAILALGLLYLIFSSMALLSRPLVAWEVIPALVTVTLALTGLRFILASVIQWLWK